jgi:hypothetical protein
MGLNGQNLAASIRPGVTWNQATDILGSLENGVRSCYASLDLWDNWKARGTIDTINVAILQTISADDAQKLRPMLDEELAGLYAFDTIVQEHVDDGDEPMDDDMRFVLQSKTQTSSDLIALVDKLFHTSVIDQVSDAIVPVAGNFADGVANVLSKVLGNLVAGLWPWLLAAGVLLVLYLRAQTRLAKAVL